MKTTQNYEETTTFEHAEVKYETSVITTYKPVAIKSKLPKLPIALWNQIVTFLCDVSKNNDTEATLSLTIVDKQWIPIVWFQEPSGQLHVKFDVTSQENKELLSPELEAALENVHCTIHSHNKSKAFQSPDDQDDELAKKGWHITVGNCDKPTNLSTHCRLNCSTHAVFNDQGKKEQDAWQEFIECKATRVIKTPPLPLLIPADCRDTVNNLIVQRNHDVEYPGEWSERIKKKPTPMPQLAHRPYGQTPNRHYGKRHMGTGINNNPTQKNYIAIADSIYIEDEHFNTGNQYFQPTWALIQLFFQIYNGKQMVKSLPIHIQASISGTNVTLENNVKEAYTDLLHYCEEERLQEVKNVINAIPPVEIFMQLLIRTWTNKATGLTNKQAASIIFLKQLCVSMYQNIKK